jgi:outer membrane protein TolC
MIMRHTPVFHPTVLLCLCLVAPLRAQETQRLSLRAAIDYAYDQNTAIKNARISVLDAEQQIIERRAFGLPRLSGDVNFQRYLQVPRQPLPQPFIDFLEAINPGQEVQREASFFLKNNFTAGLSLETMVFDFSYFVGLRAARVYRSYTAQELTTRKREVRDQVIEAYLPVMLLDENAAILRRNIDNLEKLLRETRALYQEGFAEQLDVDRQVLSLNNLRTEYESLLRRREVALSRLKYAIGYPVEQALDIDEKLEDLAAAIEDEADISTPVNLYSRPEYLLAEEGEKLNELNVKLNQAAYLPSLRAFGNTQYLYQGDNFRDGFWAPTSLVGIRLSVPIFDGLERKARVQRARLELESLRNQKIDLESAIHLEVKNARAGYLDARRRLDDQRENLKLAQRIYDTTQVKYREGVGASLEIAQAEQGLYSAQSNYTLALYELLMAKIALETALGRGE